MAFTTLVGTETLAAHLGDSSWVIFDCRHDLRNPDYGPREYAKSHVPGARFMHLDRDLSGPPTGRNGRHPLPDPQAFMRKLGAAGVDRTKQVVAYDAHGGAYASRLWWMLRWVGHDAAAVLDGGFGKWLREDWPETDDIPQPRPVQFAGKVRPIGVDLAFVQAHLRDPALALVDARAAERYAGATEPLDPVAGHIPGSISAPNSAILAADGTFRSAAELRAHWRRVLGERRADEVVHTCGSGVAACHNLLAMEVAGLCGSRLYAGSWSEWCADPSRPVATGPQP
ncbi:MAG: sulfurtransferase [Burkholderiales bacterium]|nr:sulfurtransferase [Burkholderiales bacterium]